MGRYLEVKNFTDRFHEFECSNQSVAVPSASVFYPQVPTQKEKVGKKDKFVCKIANDVILELQVMSTYNILN